MNMSPTLNSLLPREELRRVARQARKPSVEKSVTQQESEAARKVGWTIVKAGKRKVKLQRPKDKVTLFLDRLWTLLYDLDFTHLSGKGGIEISEANTHEQGLNKNFLLAIDNDVALIIKFEPCTAELRTDVVRAALPPSLQASVEAAVRETFGPRTIGCAIWLDDNEGIGNLSDLSGEALRVFGPDELCYYEELVKQLGPAAKYQLLADVFEGRQIPNMKETLPAIYTQLGAHPCYIFAASPAHLLKIAYIAHRSKGQNVATATYQRLMKKSRMAEISNYIKNDNGYFPTNIVVNFKTPQPLHFVPAESQSSAQCNDSRLGWLELPAYYKAAWVIDGQHRLYGYAYSDLADAQGHEVTVLAFDNLPVSEQVRLFVEINGKQKRVRQNLLIELFADLHWGSKDPEELVKAVIARALLALNRDQHSPFYDRILEAEDKADARHSITLNTLFKELYNPVFFDSSKGFFWRNSPDAMVQATCRGLNTWFDRIAHKAIENWNRGKGEGGGLGTNDSVASLLMLLRSIVEWYRGDQNSQTQVTCETYIERFADALAEYFAGFSEEEWREYRSGRGGQGQLNRMKQLQLHLHNRFPEFNPDLADFESAQKRKRTEEARQLIDNLERLIKKHVVSTLKHELGGDEKGWWMKGIPTNIRKKIDERRNEDGSNAQPRDTYFDLIDYREIAKENWTLFRATLGDDQSKEKGTKWMVTVNDLRKLFYHGSREQPATPDDVRQLRSILEKVRERIPPKDSEVE